MTDVAAPASPCVPRRWHRSDLHAHLGDDMDMGGNEELFFFTVHDTNRDGCVRSRPHALLAGSGR